MSIGYLKHGHGTAGPFCCESVPVRERGWPHAGEYEAHWEGRWRKVHAKVKTPFDGYIIYYAQKVYIQFA